MADYRRLPYVAERRPRNLRLADLYLRQGEAQADSIRRSGDISAAMWGNVGQAVGQTAANIIQAPQMERERLTKEADAAQVRESRELQLGEQRRAVNDRENLDLAMGQGTRAKVFESLKSRPDLLEQAQQRFAKIDASFKQLFTDAAEGIAHFGYTPEAANAALDDLVDNGFDAQKLAPYRQAFQDPNKIRTVVDGILGKTAVAPKTREIKTRGADGNETIQIVPDVPGQSFTSTPEPKAPGSIEQQIADALAKGDTATVQRLTKAAELAAGAKRAPAGDGSRFWVIRGGKPLRVTDATYQEGDLPASTREQGRPVTSGDANRIADLNTSLDDLDELTTILGGVSGSTGTRAKVGAMLPNWVTELTGRGVGAKQKQATIDRVKQVIGKALEGGVLRKEDEVKYEKILPTIYDVPEVVTTKLKGLQEALTKRRQTLVDALSDAGYDVGDYTERQSSAGTIEYDANGNRIKK